MTAYRYKGESRGENFELHRKLSESCAEISLQKSQTKHARGILSKSAKIVFPRLARIFSWLVEDSSVDSYGPKHPT